MKLWAVGCGLWAVGCAGVESTSANHSVAPLVRAEAGEIVQWEEVGHVDVDAGYGPFDVNNVSWVHREPAPAESTLDRLAQGVYEDDSGVLWRAVAVDEARLAEQLLELGYIVEADHGEPFVLSDVTEPAVGEVMTGILHSWDKQDCLPLAGPDGDDDQWIWDGESRDDVAWNTDRQKAVVRILSTVNGVQTSCTGTILRDRAVLTAAHCKFVASTGAIRSNSTFTIVNWSGETRGVNGSYTAGWTPSDTNPDADWALLRLTTPFSSFNDMDISTHSNATLNAVGANFQNLGFPSTLLNCDVVQSGTMVHSNDMEITALTSQGVRYKGDSGKGHSGGPVYFCPTLDDTVCASGELGHVVVVDSTWSSYYDRHVGPKGPAFVEEAGAIMDLSSWQ